MEDNIKQVSTEYKKEVLIEHKIRFISPARNFAQVEVAVIDHISTHL